MPRCKPQSPSSWHCHYTDWAVPAPTIIWSNQECVIYLITLCVCRVLFLFDSYRLSFPTSWRVNGPCNKMNETERRRESHHHLIQGAIQAFVLKTEWANHKKLQSKLSLGLRSEPITLWKEGRAAYHSTDISQAQTQPNILTSWDTFLCDVNTTWSNTADSMAHKMLALRPVVLDLNCTLNLKQIFNYISSISQLRCILGLKVTYFNRFWYGIENPKAWELQ